jgi:hypothetical protein
MKTILQQPQKQRLHGMLQLISKLLCFSLILIWPNCFCFGQNWEMFESKRDVLRADPNVERIRIPHLPLEQYHLLSKFKRLREVSFYWEGANDKKLRQLSNLTLTNLQLIFLLDCPDVTDQGISTLANIHSLRGLGLEGTSITDAGVDVMAARMKLTSVNVANCGGVTQNGIRALARCPSLKKLSFSGDRWTQDEIIELIGTFENVNWCGIVDHTNRLDRQLLEDKGKAKGIQVVVTRTGALEDNRRFRKEHSLR